MLLKPGGTERQRRQSSCWEPRSPPTPGDLIRLARNGRHTRHTERRQLQMAKWMPRLARLRDIVTMP